MPAINQMPNNNAVKHLLWFLFVLLISGCAVWSPSPSTASYAVKDFWQGKPVADLESVMGPPVSQQNLADGYRRYHWRKEETVTGPPRHEFGPRGRIKTRPGMVDFYYCDAFATADASGKIEHLEFQGPCPPSLLPPSGK